MKFHLLALSFILSTAISQGQEYRHSFGGTVFLSEITADRVNIREHPSLAGSVITQLNRGDGICITGISKAPQTIDKHTAYWFRINRIENKEYPYEPLGWVFGRFAKDSSQLTPNALVPLQLRIEDGVSSLSVAAIRGGQRKEIRLYLHKRPTQPFYTFTWSDDEDEFLYTDVPGTYAWFPDSNQLMHVAYIGDSSESAWTYLTDDMRFAMQDSGTSPGVRGLRAWDVQNSTKIFSGSYYEDINIKGHQFEFVIAYTEWNILKGRIDAETEHHAKEYIRTNPQPKIRPDGLNNTLIIVYIFDLDSRTRKFLQCGYVPTQ